MSNQQIYTFTLSLLISVFSIRGFAQPSKAIDATQSLNCEITLTKEELSALENKTLISAHANYQLGQHYGCQEDLPNAVKALQQAIKLDPEFAYANLALGHLYAIEQKWDQAIAAYQTVIKLDPNLGEAYPYLTQIYLQLKQTQQAQETLDKAIPVELLQSFDARYSDAGYLEAQPLLQKGQQYLKKGKLTKAEPLLRRAFNLNPSNVDAAFALSDLLIQKDQFQSALNVVEQSYEYVQSRLKHNHPITPFWHYMLMAHYFVAKGDDTTAIKILETLEDKIAKELESTPKDVDLIRSDQLQSIYASHIPAQLGALFVRQGNEDAAIQAYQNAFQRTAFASGANNQSKITDETAPPQETLSLFYLGDTYASQAQSLKAIATYQKALAKYPSFPPLLTKLGLVQIRQENIPAALVTYQKLEQLKAKENQESLDTETIRSRAVRLVAEKLIGLGRVEDAYRLIQTDLAKFPTQNKLSLYQDVILYSYRQTGANQQAIELIKQLLPEASPEQRLSLQVELAFFQLERQDYTAAEQTTKEVIKNFSRGEALTYVAKKYLAESYGYQNRIKEAIAVLQERIQQPNLDITQFDELEFYPDLGNALASRQNDEAAILVFQAMRDRADQTNRLEDSVNAQIKIAEIYLQQDRRLLAQPYLERIITSSENKNTQSLAHTYLAKMHVQAGNYSKAIASYRQAHKNSWAFLNRINPSQEIPQDVYVYSTIGKNLMELQRPQLAEEFLTQAIQFDANVSLPFQIRGQLYEKLGHLDLAIADYENAIAAIPIQFRSPPVLTFTEFDPKLFELYLGLGRLLLQRNQPKAAQEKLEWALLFDGNHQEAQALSKKAIAEVQDKAHSKQSHPNLPKQNPHQ